jgi:hypothetical protein
VDDGRRRATRRTERLIKLGVNGILSDLPAVMNSLLADMAKRRDS